jgi:hypothetical protein
MKAISYIEMCRGRRAARVLLAGTNGAARESGPFTARLPFRLCYTTHRKFTRPSGLNVLADRTSPPTLLPLPGAVDASSGCEPALKNNTRGRTSRRGKRLASPSGPAQPQVTSPVAAAAALRLVRQQALAPAPPLCRSLQAELSVQLAFLTTPRRRRADLATSETASSQNGCEYRSRSSTPAGARQQVPAQTRSSEARRRWHSSRRARPDHPARAARTPHAGPDGQRRSMGRARGLSVEAARAGPAST